MKLAALDLGTNTFLMLICEVSGEGNSISIDKVYSDHLEVTRLGQGVHQSQRLHPEALDRAEKCFQKYQNIIRESGVEKTIAVATSAARDAINGQELFDLGSKYGIPISIIPGQMEAEISFQGAIWSNRETEAPTAKKNFAVIDVGGGSTEILFQNSNGRLCGESLNIGSVRLTEMFVSRHPIPQNEMSDLRNYVLEVLSNFKKKWQPIPDKLNITAVAGTPTSLACLIKNIEFEESEIQDVELSIENIEKSISVLSALNLEYRQKKLWMDPKRADVIVAGALILSEAAQMLSSKSIKVSTRGVRYGVALNWQKFLLFLFSILFFNMPSYSKTNPVSAQKLKAVQAQIGSKKIDVEVADKEESRNIGLMNRLSMPENHGMLFVFDSEEVRNFWMKNTFLPLAIGFFDSKCRLVDIQEMKPVKSLTDVEIPQYESRFPAKFALEMNAGWFTKNKIKLKDQLSLSPHCPKSH